jgi:hypothetical protein
MIPAAILGPAITLLAAYPRFQNVMQTQEVMMGILTGVQTTQTAQELTLKSLVEIQKSQGEIQKSQGEILKSQGETLSKLDRDVTRILDVLTQSRYTLTHVSSVFPEENGEL